MSQTAYITGASSGIGRRLAELLAARGDRVVGFDREARSEETIAVDVRDADAVEAAFATAQERVGPPSLVVNSAGIQLGKAFVDLTAEEFTRVVEVNLLGSRHVAAAGLRRLAPGGHLVLVASLAGLVPNYGYAAYCASKYGVVGLAEVLRLECRPRGIRVSCVCPPEVETPMVDEERRSELAPTRALKDLAGTLDLEPAVQGILKGIDRGDFLIMPSARARGARNLARFLPARLAHAVSDRVVARELRRSA
jgi:NAD(P)-dependent dehydrogenase (short-subunit alcohol dehydrogenase family)